MKCPRQRDKARCQPTYSIVVFSTVMRLSLMGVGASLVCTLCYGARFFPSELDSHFVEVSLAVCGFGCLGMFLGAVWAILGKKGI